MKIKQLDSKLKSYIKLPYFLHFEDDESEGKVDVYGDLDDSMLARLDKGFDNFQRK